MSNTTTATIGAPAAGAWEAPGWRKTLAPYTRPRISRSVIDILTSVVPYLALITAMYFLIDVSYLIVLALSIPAAGFLVRTFILFHDCGHGSFLPSSKANVVGSVCSVLVFMPFERWRHQHAVHHATSGDLERRGIGDVPTQTVDEYYAMPWRGRLGYRLFRNPIVMFGLGPIWAQIIGPRMISRDERPRVSAASGAPTGLAVIVGAMCWLLGWQEFLLVQIPSALLAGSAGIWLFYVQHQFEDAYWESQRGLELRRRRAARQLVPEAAEDPAVLLRQHRPPPRSSPERADPELQPAAGTRRERGLPQRPDADALGRNQVHAAEGLGRAQPADGGLAPGTSQPQLRDRKPRDRRARIGFLIRRPCYR